MPIQRRWITFHLCVLKALKIALIKKNKKTIASSVLLSVRQCCRTSCRHWLIYSPLITNKVFVVPWSHMRVVSAVLFTPRNFVIGNLEAVVVCTQCRGCHITRSLTRREPWKSLSGLQSFVTKTDTRSDTGNEGTGFFFSSKLNVCKKQVVLCWFAVMLHTVSGFRLSFSTPPLPQALSALIGCSSSHCSLTHPQHNHIFSLLDIFQASEWNGQTLGSWLNT